MKHYHHEIRRERGANSAWATGLPYWARTGCLLVIASLLLLSSPITYGQEKAKEPDVPAGKRSKAASRAFAEGTRLFEAGDYVGAVDAFRRAYQLRPHFFVLCNIALSYEQLGDFIESVAFFQRCLDEGGSKTKNAESVRRSLHQAQARLSWLEVSSQGQGGTIYYNGRKVGIAPQRFPMNPGTHIIEVRKPGAKTRSMSLTTRGGGEEKRIVLVPEPLNLSTKEKEVIAPLAIQPETTPRRPLSSWWFWGGAGFTATMALVATILGAQTLSIRSDYEENPSQDLLDSGKSRRLATNVFWGLALAGAGGTTALFFFTDFQRGESSSGASSVAPERKVSIGLQGTF